MRKELCLEYDRIVTGQKKTYSSSFFKVNEEIARDNALAIMRYAFEYFLCWTPEDIANSLTFEILKIMKLFYIRTKFIMTILT